MLFSDDGFVRDITPILDRKRTLTSKIVEDFELGPDFCPGRPFMSFVVDIFDFHSVSSVRELSLLLHCAETNVSL